MKTLYQNEGRDGDPTKEAGTDYSKILQRLASMILGGGAEQGTKALEVIQEALGLDETSRAMDEFNEAADQMPSAREEGVNNRPDRRDMAPMQKMRPRGILDSGQYMKRHSGTMDSIRNPEKEVAMKDKYYRGPQPSRSIGEGIEPRKRLFRRR
tara:strand:+ start:430 stop:891 length:462 start_codon:yes stop_codon:yes gene_type:complete